jgi:glycosyltransferase involved in cell wall biosynthesis
MSTVVLAHDYATQRGGAERVALMLSQAFPGAPMHATLYDPVGTFPEFGGLDLRTTRLDKHALLRRYHRLALPLLASAVDADRVEGDVLLASSTGWAHGYRGAARTVVYCHSPARWLYQTDRYLGSHTGAGVVGRVRRAAMGGALGTLAPRMRRWDAAAAARADLYVANSTVTQRAVADVYGIRAEVLPPPPALLPGGEERRVDGVEPGFLLCVARLMPYKNVDVIVEAVNSLPGVRLVVVGAGPDRARLQALAGPRVQLLGRVDDDDLRWLYRNTAALVAASYEDYGLSPLEAGAFGKPSVVLGDGGYLDTVVPGRTGVFFSCPEPTVIAEAIEEALRMSWSPRRIAAHVATFGADRFCARLREIVAAVSGQTRPVGLPNGMAPLAAQDAVLGAA